MSVFCNHHFYRFWLKKPLLLFAVMPLAYCAGRAVPSPAPAAQWACRGGAAFMHEARDVELTLWGCSNGEGSNKWLRAEFAGNDAEYQEITHVVRGLAPGKARELFAPFAKAVLDAVRSKGVAFDRFTDMPVDLE